MNFKELVLANRSYRRFYQDVRIDKQEILTWVDLARLSASGRNAQPLKYLVYTNKEECAKIFPFLAWAGYLTQWAGPEEGERPAAYVIMLGDIRIAKEYFCDHGIAAQSLLLAAVNDGFGGCIVANIQRVKMREALLIPEHFDIIQVIAFGKPKEKVVLESISEDGDVKYWRDAEGTHHVPKRGLDEIVINL